MLRVQRNGAAERRVKRRRGIAAGQARAGIKAHSRQTLALAQIGAKHARVHSFYIIGGYEVRPNAPISQVGQFSNPNNDNTAIIVTNDGVRATYDTISGKSYQGKVEYITDSSNTRVVVEQNKIQFNLAKMIGKEAKKISEKKLEDKKATPREIAAWNKKRWYYRVDDIDTGSNTTEDIMNQTLPQKASYMDVYSFQLNGNGYADVTQIKEFGITQEDISDGKVIALTDLFVALNGDKAASLLEGVWR